MLKLNLGSGTKQPEGWINVDYSLGARLNKVPFYNFINRRFKIFDKDGSGNVRDWSKTFIHNLNKKLPWSDGSVDIIYTSHTLEHFSKEEGLALLKECRRVLKKDGIVRVIVPDLKYHVLEYTSGNVKGDDFIKSLGVLYTAKEGFLKKLLLPITQFPHRCMYDTETLVQVLQSLGFSATEMPPFKSAIPDIGAIELEDRTVNAVIVEGRKTS